MRAGTFSSNELIWSTQSYVHTTSPAGYDFYDGTWAHIVPERALGSTSCGVSTDGDADGGLSATTTQTMILVIGCANHGASTNVC